MKFNVKNLNGTSDNIVPYPYSSWLNYWRLKSNEINVRCHRCGNSQNLVGAHVQLSRGGNQWYIVPLCSQCNHPSNQGSFSVDGPLVPVSSFHEILK